MAGEKAVGKVEQVDGKIDKQLSKAARAKEVAELMSKSVSELLGKTSNIKGKMPIINPKLVLYSTILIGLLGVGGLVYYKLDYIKEKVDNVMKKVEKEKPMYSINEGEQIKGIPRNNGTILVLYELKGGEKVIVNRNFSNYFLDCPIYELITPEGEITHIYITSDKFNKEDLPKESIIEGVKIKFIKKERTEQKPAKLFFNN